MTEFMSETAIGHYNLKRMGLVYFIVTYELLLQPVFLIGSFHTTVKPLWWQAAALNSYEQSYETRLDPFTPIALNTEINKGLMLFSHLIKPQTFHNSRLLINNTTCVQATLSKSQRWRMPKLFSTILLDELSMEARAIPLLIAGPDNLWWKSKQNNHCGAAVYVLAGP